MCFYGIWYNYGKNERCTSMTDWLSLGRKRRCLTSGAFSEGSLTETGLSGVCINTGMSLIIKNSEWNLEQTKLRWWGSGGIWKTKGDPTQATNPGSSKASLSESAACLAKSWFRRYTCATWRNNLLTHHCPYISLPGWQHTHTLHTPR